MTHPATDFRDDQTRWLMEALSLSSTEAALLHLGRGWRQFTSATAVLVCQQTLAKACGVFLRENESPQVFPCLRGPFPNVSQEELEAEQAGNGTPETLLQELLPNLRVDDFTLQPVVSLEVENQTAGWVWLWTADQRHLNITEWDWLQAASARVLANQARLAEQLLADKLSRLAEFAAGAGHEINNPVATISGRAQGLLQNETDPERRRQLMTLGGQALRIRDMIGDTMLFARPPVPHPEWLDLQDILPEITEPLHSEMESRSANFHGDINQSIPVFADRVQLAVVISELLHNSLDWLAERRPYFFGAVPLETPAGAMARIVIEDDGRSFALDEETAFVRSFLLRPAGWSGLGLWASEMLANRVQSSGSLGHCLAARPRNPPHRDSGPLMIFSPPRRSPPPLCLPACSLSPVWRSPSSFRMPMRKPIPKEPPPRFRVEAPAVALEDVPLARGQVIRITALTPQGEMDKNFQSPLKIEGLRITQNAETVSPGDWKAGILEIRPI